MSEINFSIVSPTGVVTPLASEADEPGRFRLMKGAMGFGAPPVDVEYSDTSADGVLPVHFSVGAREMLTPIGTPAGSRAEMWELQRELEAACHRVPDLPYPRFQAKYADGTTLELPFYVLSGFEDTYGDGGEKWHVWPLQLQAPYPYWRATTFTSFEVSDRIETVDLLDDLAAMVLMPSDTFGESEVVNAGEVHVYPRWELIGPYTSATIAAGEDGFTLTAPIEAGERRIIERTETRAYRVLDGDGVSRYSELGPAPRFPRLAPGNRRMTITLTAATIVSKVLCSFRIERRSVY